MYSHFILSSGCMGKAHLTTRSVSGTAYHSHISHTSLMFLAVLISQENKQ